MKYRLAALAAFAAIGIGYAVAQIFPPVGQVATIGPADLVQIIPNGAPTAPDVYAPAQQIGSIQTYVNGGVLSTAFTYTFVHGQKNYFAQPAGTLATGTLTTEVNPSDGQLECFTSTQTQTALTWTANTGQTMNAGVRASGVASVPTCIQYSRATATWYQSGG